MISHAPPGPVQVFWRRPRFWLLVVSSPQWIALTAPARWLLDRPADSATGLAWPSGRRGAGATAAEIRPARRFSGPGRTAPGRSCRACSARPCADRAAERTAKSYGSSAADAAAVVGATSGQADRTARLSGPQYGRERRRDNAPVPPLGALWRPTATAGRGAPEWEFWRAAGQSDWGWVRLPRRLGR
jgi:hypothetical protein